MSDTPDRLNNRLKTLSRSKPQLEEFHGAARYKQRRQEEREPAFKFARLLFPNGAQENCVVKDLSAAGARIATEGALVLPEEVVLSVDQSARRFLARVAWRRESEAGLFFKAELGRDVDVAAIFRPIETRRKRPAPKPPEQDKSDDEFDFYG